MAMADETYNAGAQFRVTAVGEFDEASDVMNVFEYIKTDTTPVSGQTVIDDLLEIFENLYVIVVSINNILTVWRGIRIEELDGDNATGFLAFPGGDIAGVLQTDAAPLGVAALINFPTGVKNRQLRKYFGVLDESILTERGNISVTAQADMTDIAAFLVTTQSETSDWHYSHNAGPTIGVLQPTTAEVQGVPAYQRRRKPGVGG